MKTIELLNIGLCCQELETADSEYYAQHGHGYYTVSEQQSAPGLYVHAGENLNFFAKLEGYIEPTLISERSENETAR